MSRDTAKKIDPEILLEEVKYLSIKKLAQKYQVNPTTIFRKLAKTSYKGKLGRRKIKLDNERLAKQLQYYTMQELAKKYGISMASMCSYVKENIPEFKPKRGRRIDRY